MPPPSIATGPLPVAGTLPGLTLRTRNTELVSEFEFGFDRLRLHDPDCEHDAGMVSSGHAGNRLVRTLNHSIACLASPRTPACRPIPAALPVPGLRGTVLTLSIAPRTCLRLGGIFPMIAHESGAHGMCQSVRISRSFPAPVSVGDCLLESPANDTEGRACSGRFKPFSDERSKAITSKTSPAIQGPLLLMP